MAKNQFYRVLEVETEISISDRKSRFEILAADIMPRHDSVTVKWNFQFGAQTDVGERHRKNYGEQGRCFDRKNTRRFCHNSLLS